MKRTLLIILMIGLSVMAICGGWSAEPRLMATAQNPQALPNPSPKGSGASELPAPATLPAETLLKIRDLQLAQANRTLRMKAMELAYQKLQDAQDADTLSIDAIVVDAAKTAGVDLTKFVFDISQSKFLTREKPAAKDEAMKKPD